MRQTIRIFVSTPSFLGSNASWRRITTTDWIPAKSRWCSKSKSPRFSTPAEQSRWPPTVTCCGSPTATVISTLFSTATDCPSGGNRPTSATFSSCRTPTSSRFTVSPVSSASPWAVISTSRRWESCGSLEKRWEASAACRMPRDDDSPVMSSTATLNDSSWL